MGRRSVPVDDPGRWVFNRLAPAYRRRPGYPAAIIDRLAALAARGARAVELGAGAGHLALPLATRGVEVTAVEPALEMLAVLREALSAGPDPKPRVRLVHAAAEATGLEAHAFDLVVVADALHWMDPERAGAEAHRLLRPRGAVAVVEASFAATPFMEGLTALLARANPRTRRRPPGAVRQFLRLAAGPGLRAGCVHEEHQLQDVPLGDAELEAVLRSLSHVGPALGPAALARLLTEARALAQATGGARFTRDLVLRWAAGRD